MKTTPSGWSLKSWESVERGAGSGTYFFLSKKGVDILFRYGGKTDQGSNGRLRTHSVTISGPSVSVSRGGSYFYAGFDMDSGASVNWAICEMISMADHIMNAGMVKLDGASAEITAEDREFIDSFLVEMRKGVEK